VAKDSSVPSRIRLVSRARAPRVTQALVGPGSPAPPMASTAHGEVVVGAEERLEAEPLTGLCHCQQLIVGPPAALR